MIRSAPGRGDGDAVRVTARADQNDAMLPAMGKTIATALLAAAITVQSGCSMLFMERLPERHNPKVQPYCTATKGFVAWDGALAAAHIISLAVNFYAASEAEWDDTVNANKLGAVISVFGSFGHIASASIGSKDANRCVQARRVYETHRLGGDAQ